MPKNKRKIKITWEKMIERWLKHTWSDNKGRKSKCTWSIKFCGFHSFLVEVQTNVGWHFTHYSKSHSFWMVKICSKIHMCSQKQSCWLPPFNCVIKQWSIIKSAINQLLFNHLVNDIQSKRGNQQDSFWLAHMNLAMHFDHSKLRNLDFL